MSTQGDSGYRCFVCCIPLVMMFGLAFFLIAFSWHRAHRRVSHSVSRPVGGWPNKIERTE